MTAPAPTGPQALAWTITYADASSHRVETRPGDYVRLSREYGTDWKAREDDAPEMMLYLAWLASRHDPTGMARLDFDTFLDDVLEVGSAEVPVRPTGAAHGNASPSSSPSPSEPAPANGSMLTPATL